MFKHITAVIKDLLRESELHETPIVQSVAPAQPFDMIELPEGMMDNYFWDGFTWVEYHSIPKSKPVFSTTL